MSTQHPCDPAYGRPLVLFKWSVAVLFVVCFFLQPDARARSDEAPPAETKLRWVYRHRAALKKVEMPAVPPQGIVYPNLTVADGAVLFTCLEDHRLLCLDADNGKLRWEFTTAAQVREAPALADGKVYLASDDGFVYCLDARTGKVLWTIAPPADRWIMAYGSLISAWPAKTNVLLHQGVAYFGSGVFPHDGAFITAVDAGTGKTVWRNGETSEIPYEWSAVSPIGRITIDGDKLLVPNEGMEGKALTLADGREILKGAKKYRQQIHVVGVKTEKRTYTLGKSSSEVICSDTSDATQHSPIEEKIVENPFDSSATFSAAAEAIVKHGSPQEGYALVLDSENGALSLELARRTKLRIYAVFADGEKLAAARALLQQTGLYGTRIVAHYHPADKPIPYPPFFADLIVSEGAVTGRLSLKADDVQRLLKPVRGVAMLGSADAASIQADAISGWTKGSGFANWTTLNQDGRWAKLIRPRLENGGGWTHQNADAANTSCSHDAVLKAPLGVAWYGEPMSKGMVNRTGMAPLLSEGVLVCVGAEFIGGYDQYTGRKLWRHEMRRASRDNPYGESGNFVANRDSVFQLYGHQVIRYDLVTGEIKQKYSGINGWLSCDDKLLYGTSGSPSASKAVFAKDIETGKELWKVDSGTLQFQNNTITVGGGRLFFIMDGFSPESKKQSVDEFAAYSGKLAADELKRFEETREVRDTRILVGVDTATGKKVIERGIDVTDCGGTPDRFQDVKNRKYPPGLIYQDGILLTYNISAGGKLWGNWVNDHWAWRGVSARSAEDGRLLWYKRVNYRGRLVVIDQTVYADPWALDLKTGEFKKRKNPITEEEDKWTWCRYGKHCGVYVASQNFLFGRSGGIGYHDLQNDRGLYTFHHSRASCWIDTVSGGGLMVKPPLSNGCTCEISAHFTVALGTVPQQPATAEVYPNWGPTLPVKNLNVNFGANGDRHDAAGNLWVAPNIPRPTRIPLLQFKPHEEYYPGGSRFARSAVFSSIENTDQALVFASSAFGLKKTVIEVAGEKDPAATFTVELGFAAPQGDREGQRVFDIKLQGKTVLKSFDIAKEAGGANRALWKRFDDVAADKTLTLELVAGTETPTPQQLPLINGLKIRRK